MKFREYGNLVVVDFKYDELSVVSLNSIVSNTYNTWQLNRDNTEKMADTQLGKLAEEITIKILSFYEINNYFSYDFIRIDDFKNHAPFDGIITNNFSAEVKEIINEGVKNFGAKLNTEIRQKLRNLGVTTVEIKSTRISDKYKQKNNFISYDDENSLKRLITYLNTLDFISYPYFTRYGNMNFEKYCYFAKEKLKLDLDGYDLFEYIKEYEINNSCDLFIRIFVDESNKRAIIMGYIDKISFFNPPELKKLVQFGKSDVPLYFVKSISKGKSLKSILDAINKL